MILIVSSISCYDSAIWQATCSEYSEDDWDVPLGAILPHIHPGCKPLCYFIDIFRKDIEGRAARSRAGVLDWVGVRARDYNGKRKDCGGQSSSPQMASNNTVHGTTQRMAPDFCIKLAPSSDAR